MQFIHVFFVWFFYRLLKQSLPEAFFATDYDGLQFMLLLQRLSAKAAIVKKHTQAQFRLHPGLSLFLIRFFDPMY
jgi:hypothetical protein